MARDPTAQIVSNKKDFSWCGGGPELLAGAGRIAGFLKWINYVSNRMSARSGEMLRQATVRQ